MATTLYFWDDAASLTLTGSVASPYVFASTRGNAATSVALTNPSSGSQFLDGSGKIMTWMSDQLEAVTISGTVSVNLWGLESAMTTNAGLGINLLRYSYNTDTSSWDSLSIAPYDRGIELGTSNAVYAWTFTPTSLALSPGDRLGVQVVVNAVGSIGSGTVTYWFNGTTGGASGDAFVTFTETLASYVPPEPRSPRVRKLQAVNRAAVI